MNKEIEQTIERLTLLDAAITEMAYILKNDRPCIQGTEATFAMPYDFVLIRENRLHFEAHGFNMSHETQWTDDGVLGQWFFRDNIAIVIFYRPEMSGSTCKLNKIGETTKTVPVYEVTCLEALS